MDTKLDQVVEKLTHMEQTMQMLVAAVQKEGSGHVQNGVVSH